MSFKGTVIGVATVASLATGAMWYVQPHTTNDVDQHQRQVQIDQGSDAVEQENARQQKKLGDGVDMETQERARPGEHRPPIKFHFRP